MVNASVGWAVGNYGIFKTTDGGTSWNSQLTPSTALYSILFADAYTGWAVGGYGNTYSTTDGGTNWTPKTNDIGNFRCLCGINSSTIWVVGDNSTIYKSTDGGSTWIKQLTNVNSNFYAVQFVDANNGWVVGDNGAILHTTSAGVVLVGDKPSAVLPARFELFQNYPNPFNPTTTISFNLPSAGFTALKIYDIVGREAATLLSQEMSVGGHSVRWNASALASGIYFYQLRSGNYISTKKLVLLK
jgi:hypothetical protein